MLARSAVPGHLLRSAAVTANPAVATAALLQRRWYRGEVDPAPSFYNPPPTPANLGLSIVPEKKEFVLERFGKYLLPCSWRMITCSSDGYVSALYHTYSYHACRALHIASKLNSSSTYPVLELFFQNQAQAGQSCRKAPPDPANLRAPPPLSLHTGEERSTRAGERASELGPAGRRNPTPTPPQQPAPERLPPPVRSNSRARRLRRGRGRKEEAGGTSGPLVGLLRRYGPRPSRQLRLLGLLEGMRDENNS
ncbi:hypothetical protein ZWY2020_023667 [Hordeum vulgare]|nr:hypothetical protein ZWY2020_023667 [Hordeum vulgare]